MNKLKRIMVSILASLMLCTSVSLASDVDGLAYDKKLAIKKTTLTNVMTGTDKGFEPNKNLTRAEAAAIMTRVYGVSKEECDDKKDNSKFSDVLSGNWATGYITIANELGLVKGIGDGKFAPNDYVTVTQFKTMAIRAMGAGSFVESSGVWPDNYIDFAKKQGIGVGIDSMDSDIITRSDAAMVIEDVLAQDMFVGNESVAGKNILNTRMNIEQIHVKSIKKDSNNTVSYTYDKLGNESSEVATLADGIELDSLKDCDIWIKKVSNKNEIILVCNNTADDQKIEPVVNVPFDGYFSEIKGSDILAAVNSNKEITVKKDSSVYTFGFNDNTLAEVIDNELITNYSIDFVKSVKADKKYHGIFLLEDNTVNIARFLEYDEVRKIKSIKTEGDYIIFELNGAGEFVKTFKDSISEKIEVGDNLYVSFKENDYMLIRNENKIGEFGELRYITNANIDGKVFDYTSLIPVKPSDISKDLKINEDISPAMYDFIGNYQTVDTATRSFTQIKSTDTECNIDIQYEANRGYAFTNTNFDFQEIRGVKPEIKLLSHLKISLLYKVARNK